MGVARSLGVLLAFVSPLAFEARALAVCETPRQHVAPPSGSSVPPLPVLYVFTPLVWEADPDTSAAIRVESEGRPVAYRVAEVSSAPTFQVHSVRIDVREAGPITLVLEFPSRHEVHFEYRVDPNWTRPPSHATQVAKVTHDAESWSCSHTDAFIVTPSTDAPAYRVEWAASEADYRAGKRSRVVLPRRHLDFFDARPIRAPLAHPPELGLGYLSCFGETLPEKLSPLYVGVAALYPDGSEDPMAADPVRLDRPAILRTLDLLARFQPGPLGLEPEASCAGRWSGLRVTARLYGPFLLGLGLILAGIYWRRARRARRNAAGATPPR